MDRKKTQKFIGFVWTHFVAILALVFFKSACRGKCFGIENIRNYKKNGFVLASNHVSYLDWMVLWSYFFWEHNIKLTFLAKEKLYKHSLWGAIMKEVECIMVSNCGSKILDPDGYDKLLSSKYIAIFPEGTRSISGKLQPFRKGAIKLSFLLNKPLMPVALNGFHKAWPPMQSIPKPYKCSIYFAKPYFPNCQSCHLSSTKYYDDMISELMNKVNCMLSD